MFKGEEVGINDMYGVRSVFLLTVNTNNDDLHVGGGKIYALNAKLNELKDPTKPPSKEFSLQQVQLKPAQ